MLSLGSARSGLCVDVRVADFPFFVYRSVVDFGVLVVIANVLAVVAVVPEGTSGIPPYRRVCSERLVENMDTSCGLRYNILLHRPQSTSQTGVLTGLADKNILSRTTWHYVLVTSEDD